MGTFVQGDNGRQLLFSCGFSPLGENDKVKITIKFGDKVFTKDAEVFYSNNGRCKVSLTPLEISEIGIYEYQSTTYFNNGNVLADPDIKTFKVSEKLTGGSYDPNVLDGGAFTSESSTSFDGGGF